MFYAYYEAQGLNNMKQKQKQAAGRESSFGYGELKEEETPIILWLQGGPGCSSMIANFFELGPWQVGEDQQLHRHPAPWNRLFGLLFLDNPVGSGFSIAPSLSDIPSDQPLVALHAYTALLAFFDQFPSFLSRPFFISGESYAGKYVPSIATYLLEQQQLQIRLPFSSPSLRLDGVAIGNGLTHPIAQVPLHAPTAYYMGLIDQNQNAIADELAQAAVISLQEENWAKANDRRNELLDYIQNVTGLATLLDVRRTVKYYTTKDGVDYLSAFLNKPEVQTCLLGAEQMEWSPCSSVVRKKMANDVGKSTKHMVEALLNQSIPVLLYQGQFDLRDGVASSEAWMQLLQWEDLQDFFASERKIWTMNGSLAGYVRSFSSLTHVVISNAGHLAPADQPHGAQRMIEGWILGDGIV